MSAGAICDGIQRRVRECAILSAEMNPKILLTGKNGQVGAELCRLLPSIGDVVALDRSQLDLAKADEVRRAVREVHPNLIINAAAYTNVDQAEKDESAAFGVNAEAPAVFAEEGKKIGAAVVHYSTDYVFDGTKRSPYREVDLTCPINLYGRSKLAGEEAIQASGVPYLIFRVTWVYGRHGRNFLLTILRLSTEREELRIVRDQIGAPTWSRHIAANTVGVLAQLGNRGSVSNSVSEVSGIYHMTAGGETSWYEFALAVLQERGRTPGETPWIQAATGGCPQITRRVTPITTAEYPTPARRPAYSVLSNTRLQQTFGFQLPNWREQLHSVFRTA